MFRSPMTLDRAQRLRTALAAVFVAIVAAGTVMLGPPVAEAISLFLVVALGVSWAMAPREIVVAAGELRVERRAWAPLRVPLASIASASSIEGLGPGAVRVMGVGGFFGSYGVFASETLGRFRLYATRSGQAVLVKRTGHEPPLVITPDDVAGAIASLAKRPLTA